MKNKYGSIFTILESNEFKPVFGVDGDRKKNSQPKSKEKALKIEKNDIKGGDHVQDTEADHEYQISKRGLENLRYDSPLSDKEKKRHSALIKGFNFDGETNGHDESENYEGNEKFLKNAKKVNKEISGDIHNGQRVDQTVPSARTKFYKERLTEESSINGGERFIDVADVNPNQNYSHMTLQSIDEDKVFNFIVNASMIWEGLREIALAVNGFEAVKANFPSDYKKLFLTQDEMVKYADDMFGGNIDAAIDSKFIEMNVGNGEVLYFNGNGISIEPIDGYRACLLCGKKKLTEGASKRLRFARTKFIDEEHVLSLVPEEYRVNGTVITMTDMNNTDYKIMCEDSRLRVLNVENRKSINECINTFNKLVNYDRTQNVSKTTKDIRKS